MSDHHCLDPSSDVFTIRFLCRIASLKVQIWCKYLFNHCVDGRVYFGGGKLVWVFSSLSRYN